MQIEVSDGTIERLRGAIDASLERLTVAVRTEMPAYAESAAQAVQSCADLWKAIGAYGVEEQTVILTRAETRDHLMAWAERVGATVEEGGTA